MWMGVYWPTSAVSPSDFDFSEASSDFGSVIMDPITPLPEKPNLLSENLKIKNYELRITNYEL